MLVPQAIVPYRATVQKAEVVKGVVAMIREGGTDRIDEEIDEAGEEWTAARKARH